MPIILALIINQIRSERYKRILQTVTYLPHFISTVVVVGMIVIFLSPRAGIYGALMRLLGEEPVNIVGKKEYFRWIYVFSDIWQHTGWNSIIYLAALSSIDPTLYEASVIDGANKWQQIWHIDIPSLVPTMVILLILSAGGILGVGFEKVYLMQNSTNIAVSEV
ncbi:MAG: ABC transporter permease subunit, partial [Thermoanaerobacterium sp.]|nr:ABC transporter permease subunit [Thermoanaerobacterium sp.]